MPTYVQNEVSKGRYNDIVRESQQYQLAQVAQPPQKSHPYAVALLGLCRRFSAYSASMTTRKLYAPLLKNVLEGWIKT